MQSLVNAFQAVDRSYYGDSYNEEYRRWDLKYSLCPFHKKRVVTKIFVTFLKKMNIAEIFICRKLYSSGYDLALAVKNVYDIVHGLISRDGI